MIARSSLSWNGFNIEGDQQSIEEVQRLIHDADKAEFLRKSMRGLRMLREGVSEEECRPLKREDVA